MNSLYEKSYDFSAPTKKDLQGCTLEGKIVLDNEKWKLSEFSTAYFIDSATENDTDTEYNEKQPQDKQATIAAMHNS